MGVALADARLLLERFQDQLNAKELKEIVESIRSGSKKHLPAKKAKKTDISVEFTWQAYSKKKRKYITVRITDGGGLRRKQFQRDTKLENIFSHIKSTFFPHNKSKKHGSMALLDLKLVGTLYENLKLDQTIDCYMTANSLRQCKLIMRSKPLSVFSSLYSHSSEEDEQLPILSSDDDFAHDKRIPKDTATVTLKDKQTENSNYLEKVRNEQLKDRRSIINTQNEEFEQSLQTDKLKDKKKKEHNERNREHSLRIENMKLLLKEEPTLHDDCVLVVVKHISLGRIQRFFLSENCFAQVYAWIHTMCKEPEYFSLCIERPGNLVFPHENVKKAEHTIVMMNIEEKQFFQLNSLHCLPSLPSLPITSTPISPIAKDDIAIEEMPCCSNFLRCPICNTKQSPSTIEAHAARCADQTYVEVVESESDDESSLPKADLKIPIDVDVAEEDILSSLQKALESVKIVRDKGLSLKVRRHCMFEDYCKRFKMPWVREQLGNLIIVTFYGESGIDQGGLRREFFSGNI